MMGSMDVIQPIQVNSALKSPTVVKCYTLQGIEYLEGCPLHSCDEPESAMIPIVKGTTYVRVVMSVCNATKRYVELLF